jgi:hypothetical protein
VASTNVLAVFSREMKATGPVAETVFPVTSLCSYTNGAAKVVALRPRGGSRGAMAQYRWA